MGPAAPERCGPGSTSPRRRLAAAWLASICARAGGARLTKTTHDEDHAMSIGEAPGEKPLPSTSTPDRAQEPDWSLSALLPALVPAIVLGILCLLFLLRQ